MSLAELDQLFGLSSCFSGATYAGWTTDLAVTGPLVLGLLVYFTGVVRLWRSAGPGRGASYLQVGCFVLGWLCMAAALVSPLHDYSRRIFAAHMLEHELVMTVAAPLLVLARPLGPMLWAFPARARSNIARAAQAVAYLLGWDILTLPLVAAVLHAVAIWGWHLPGLFDAALRIEWVHWAQHLSFLVTALVFWWTIFAALPRRRPSGGVIFTLFATSVHTGFLGILIALAPATIYPLQSRDAALWHLTAMADQQLAGLIMWVPGGMIYFVAALALAALWIGRSPGRSALSLTPASAPRRA
jgi:cytochrome c oxidase assembly factor CtaG